MFAEENQEDSIFSQRREAVFIILSGLFLGSLTMLNILGISKFIDISFDFFGMHIPFIIAVGVLAYPVTFLCTDFISELYGRRRANLVVWVGLVLNFWVLFILWLGGELPPGLPEQLIDPESSTLAKSVAFYQIRSYAFGATIASMAAYLTAQFCDVHIFHFLKKITKGKHLWLRNNVSTLSSQMVDSVAVILITHYYANALPINNSEKLVPQLIVFILSAYVFKMIVALLDTIPFYIGVRVLSKYLNIDPNVGYTEEESSSKK